MDNKARSVSILVDGGQSSNNRLLDDCAADTVQNNDNEASLHGEGSPAGSEEELNNNNSPTAIPVDEGDTITALKVGDSQGKIKVYSIYICTAPIGFGLEITVVLVKEKPALLSCIYYLCIDIILYFY